MGIEEFLWGVVWWTRCLFFPAIVFTMLSATWTSNINPDVVVVGCK